MNTIIGITPYGFESRVGGITLDGRVGIQPAVWSIETHRFMVRPVLLVVGGDSSRIWHGGNGLTGEFVLEVGADVLFRPNPYNNATKLTTLLPGTYTVQQIQETT